ncbi:AbgT family transporter [Corynebacterium sp. P5875]|uniref:AbgT family transporter n=2 Tax=Corynebacterium antarcticum TaxID=2800405 RepID=A0A9Q4GP56_9CORY|nr:AbgT family transporter [Corynebacterium antarcticum]MCX7538359.1 AbgT family transporter [Corynebacterium antarcticum]
MTDNKVTTTRTPDTSTEDGKKREHATGFLGLVERLGNMLPDPFWLFVILSGLVLVSSFIGEKIGMTATNPSTGEEVRVTNLLSAEGLQRMINEAVPNFTSFPPLGLIIIVMLGVAVAEHSGLIGAAIRGAIGRVGPTMLTFVVALAGVTGSIASDAVYVILIPIGATAFRHVGRSPIVGAMVAFAASSAGFNSSLILNITDVLLAGLSTSAAEIVEPGYEVSPLANYFFVVPSAVVLALIITAVTELFVRNKARELVDHDDVDYEAASFGETPPNSSDGDTAPDSAEKDADSDASTTTGTGTDDAGETDDGEDRDEARLELHDVEKRGLVRVAVWSLVLLAAYFAAMFVPGSPLQGEDGAVMDSPLIRSIAVAIALYFLIVGIVYGRVTGTITEAADVPAFMAKGIQTLVPMMVLFFAVAQFLAYFNWSNLGVWSAIHGAELLSRADLPNPVLFGLFVLLVAVLNLMVTSGSAQWALMSPVVVPMMMYVGVSPEVSQMLFRIGDSPTNIITPMSPYFALALTFLQRYYKRAGIGTLMSLALPYSIAMLVGWFLFFLVWYFLGLPLGPGVPVR